MALAQVVGAEARAGGRARRQVLDEHVGPRQDAMQQRRVVRLLDVGDQALLAAVEPDEIAGQALAAVVVAAREVALGALDLDHPRAGVGQAGTAIGRGDRLFERDDREAGEGMRGCHAPVSDMKRFGDSSEQEPGLACQDVRVGGQRATIHKVKRVFVLKDRRYGWRLRRIAPSRSSLSGAGRELTAVTALC